MDKKKEIIKFLESELGWTFQCESWYDEEGVEGTIVYNDESEEIMSCFGWGDECNIMESEDDEKFVYEIIQSFSRLLNKERR